MLHKIKPPPEDYALHECLEFQQHLLEFACCPAQSYPLKEKQANISKFFPDYQADWLREKLYQDKGSLARSIEGLACYVNNHPEEAEKILAAFETDVEFLKQIINDQVFHFAYLSLDKEARDVIKPLMEYCYQLLCIGIPLQSSSRKKAGPNEKFTRQQLVDHFWERNHRILRVCPACDGQSPFYDRAKADAHADHFFPKARYPFLSIHPYNLVPICTDCNTFRKGTTNPLITIRQVSVSAGKEEEYVDPIEDESSESLLDTFHPYGRPAREYIEIEVVRINRGANEVRIIPSSQRRQISTKRIKNLDRVFRLTRMWGGNYMDYIVEHMVDQVRDYKQFSKDRTYPQEVVEKAFYEHISEIIGKYDEKAGTEPFFLLKHSYAKYLQNHQQHSEEIIQTIASAKDRNTTGPTDGGQQMIKTYNLRAKRRNL
ncbi:hypothetical protein [Ktedonobacter racemifer]|uniref:HNH nuclease domain-containing protein n=1 Tax=Ktedonobacter racemifer DSM 44963 TaxID=485913 RepID=D6TX40_KTERA|nr:hypothetical protein [Ktedonobacter racemifer]EFH84773.1 hypothetical protein Krac_5878 [Ktedonobacter racemifer DSM 44963]